MDALTDYDIPTLADRLRQWGFKPSHAQRLLGSFYRYVGRIDFDRLLIPRALRTRLEAEIPYRQSRVIARTEAGDGTTKLLIELDDGGTVESVFMPGYRADRAAGCISSQIGCAMGCDFCATAQAGLVRNLTAGEIAEQFLHLKALAIQQGRRLQTIVFMGMGEPMLNLDNVIGGIRRIADPLLGAVGWRNVTVSTVGIVPGIDALVFGHTHREFNARIGGVAVLQPRHWGMALGRIDFEFEPAAGGRWKLVSTRAAQVPVTPATAPDPAILELARPYHLLTESYLNTPVAESPVAMDGRLARIRDTALLDAVHAVQLHYAQADVSLTALFNPAVSIPKGPVTVRQIASLYIYENELYAVEGDGRMLKDALENAARYFLSCANQECAGSPLIAGRVAGYNFDIAQGVEYEIDLSRPEGERIRNLRFRGRPLEENQKLRIAINNYRAGGSGGYDMFRNARLLWRSSREIRDLIVEYYSERKLLPAAPDGNWRIVPDAAVRALEQEARREPGGGR